MDDGQANGEQIGVTDRTQAALWAKDNGIG
jgi:hypothetical protein